MKISKVIASALRKLGMIGYGQTPQPDQAADALNALQAIYRGLMTGGCFGRFRDVLPVGDIYTASPGDRVLRTADNPNFQFVLPDYGFDNAPILFVDELTGGLEDYLFDAQQRVWFSLADLDDDYIVGDAASLQRLNSLLDQEAPLSYRDANGLASRLAVEISADYNSAVPPAVQMASQRFIYSLTHNYAQPRRDIQPREVIANTITLVPDDSDLFAVGPGDDDTFETD